MYGPQSSADKARALMSMTKRSAYTPKLDELILPDVAHQHCEESAILFAARSGLTRARHVGLAYLQTIDERLCAHLDALVLAGHPAWRLCAAALERPSSERLFAAAVLAFSESDPVKLQQLYALVEAVPTAFPGLAAAAGWLDYPDFENTIAELLVSRSPMKRATATAASAMRRIDPGLVERRLIHDSDPRVRAVAIRAAIGLGYTTLLPTFRALLMDEDAEVRCSSAMSSTLAGERGLGLDMLMQIALTGTSHRWEAFALALQAMDVPEAHAFLRRFGETVCDDRLLIEGAGITGDPSCIPWLINLMRDHGLARRAGEAFSHITGVDLSRSQLTRSRPDGFERGPNDDPDDANIAMDEDDGLPWPDHERVQAWWVAHRDRFASGKRYFVGAPVSREHCTDVLRNGYQRQRILAAQYLCLLQPGTPLFDTGAPVVQQYRELAGLA